MRQKVTTPQERADIIRQLAASSKGITDFAKDIGRSGGFFTTFFSAAYPNLSPSTIAEAMQNSLLSADEVIAKVEATRIRINGGGPAKSATKQQLTERVELLERQVAALQELTAIMSPRRNGHA